MKPQNDGLKSYVASKAQQIGKRHLEDCDLAGLFMGCGLGKTALCLDRIADLNFNLETKGVLVFAPVRVTNMTWPIEPGEFKEFTWLRVANLRTKEGWEALEAGSAHIYVINYEGIPKLIKNYLKGRRVTKWAFDTVIYDELTAFKNPDSKRARAIRHYMFKLKRRWGLTGTPNPNSLLEVFGQVLMLDGGQRLGKSYAQFRDRYFEKEGWVGRNYVLKGQWAEDAIYGKIKDICISLKTSDYSESPDIEEVDYEIPIPKVILKDYLELQMELFAEIQGAPVLAPTAAALAGKLLQMTGGGVYSQDEDGSERQELELHTEKNKAIRAIQKSEGGGPVVIFCQFQHEQARILKGVPGAVAISSFKTAESQQQLLRDWNAGKIKALVSHPKSAAHGLNLQHGSHVIIWATPTYSGEYYEQGNRRVARRGQKRTPRVWRILCKDSIDWAPISALKRKDKGSQSLLKALKAYAKALRS
jgi:hypothetical protein